MHLIELNSTHSIERCENRWPGLPVAWVLHRWRPSELRRSGMYVPMTPPLAKASMLRALEELGMPADVIALFRDTA